MKKIIMRLLFIGKFPLPLLFAFMLLSGMAKGQSEIMGRVVEQGSGQPLEFSNISLMTPADSSMVNGTVSGMEGRFELQAEPGRYLLRVGFIGFEELWQEVSLERGTKNLGDIELFSLAAQLGEVTVEAAASLFRSEFDRRIFNLENTILAEGGTALQMLETLPSIQVDEEGNLTMRGSGSVEIYINGRPTNLSSDDTV